MSCSPRRTFQSEMMYFPTFSIFLKKHHKMPQLTLLMCSYKIQRSFPSQRHVFVVYSIASTFFSRLPTVQKIFSWGNSCCPLTSFSPSLRRQCAAVRTCLCVMRDPPQRKRNCVWRRRVIWWGNCTVHDGRVGVVCVFSHLVSQRRYPGPPVQGGVYSANDP